MSKPAKQDKKPPAKPSERTTLAKIKRWFEKYNRALFLIAAYGILIASYEWLAQKYLCMLSLNSDCSNFALNAEQVNKLPTYSTRVLLWLLPASFLLWYWRDVNKREEIAVARDNQQREERQQQLEIESKRKSDFAQIIQSLETESGYQKIAALHAIEPYLDASYASHYRNTARSILLDGHRADVERWMARNKKNQISSGITSDDIATDSVMRTRSQIIGGNFEQIATISKYFSYSEMSGLALDEADFLGGNYTRALLINTSLYKAKLKKTILWEANLQGACLLYAELQEASLWGVVLRNADLGHADLRGADLRGADLREANLRHADLTGAYIGQVDLRGAIYDEEHLSECRGYETTKRGELPDDDVPF